MTKTISMDYDDYIQDLEMNRNSGRSAGLKAAVKIISQLIKLPEEQRWSFLLDNFHEDTEELNFVAKHLGINKPSGE